MIDLLRKRDALVAELMEEEVVGFMEEATGDENVEGAASTDVDWLAGEDRVLNSSECFRMSSTTEPEKSRLETEKESWSVSVEGDVLSICKFIARSLMVTVVS